MSKSSTPCRNIVINKAQQLRQQKQKKIDDKNQHVSKQLEKSADSWQNSMEQIRRIAKKTQDSSQIIDNVFTENDNDKSEYENGGMFMPNDYQRSSVAGDMPFSYPLNNFQRPFNNYQQYVSHPSSRLDYQRPLSMYANSLHHNYPSRAVSSIDYDNYYHSNFQTPLNVNQNNVTSYPNTPSQPRFYTPPHIQRPWFQPPTHQPPPPMNVNSSNSMINQFNPYQNHYPSPYLQRMPNNFYPYNYIPQYPIIQPTYQAPTNTYSNSSSDNNNSSIESMKKYVTCLLDKLEALNDTVVKLKNENMIRKNHSINNHCHHDNFNEQYRLQNEGYHYRSIPGNLNRYPCNCAESSHNNINRSHSSNERYQHNCAHNSNYCNHSKMYPSHSYSNLTCPNHNHNNVNLAQFQSPQSHQQFHQRSYSYQYPPTPCRRTPRYMHTPRSNCGGQLSEPSIPYHHPQPPPPSIQHQHMNNCNRYIPITEELQNQVPNTNNSSQYITSEICDLDSSQIEDISLTPIDTQL